MKQKTLIVEDPQNCLLAPPHPYQLANPYNSKRRGGDNSKLSSNYLVILLSPLVPGNVAPARSVA